MRYTLTFEGAVAGRETVLTAATSLCLNGRYDIPS